MPVDVVMQKMEGRLVPVSGYDAELIDGLPLDKDLRCKITIARSDKQQRFYWVMLSKVVENTDSFSTTEALHFFIRVRTGFVDHIKLHSGETVIVPESTSYGSMDGTRFKQYLDAALEVIVADVLPGTTITELMGEL